FDLDRHADALKHYELALPLMKAKYPNHQFTFDCMQDLAETYQAMGRYAEAFKLNEETLALRKARLGPQHPDTLVTMNNLADSYIAVGEMVKAGAILQETLALREQRAKADAGNNLEQSFLAWTLGQIGEVEKARHHQPASIQAYAKSV